MADHPTLSAQLRTPAPTLEPDDVLLARLSALAAAGAPAPASAAAPRVNWRVGLAAASVAAVVVGAAWLGGMSSTDTPDQPQPAESPTLPVPSPGTSDLPGTTRSPGTSTTDLHGGLPAGPASSILDAGAGASDGPASQHTPDPGSPGSPDSPVGSGEPDPTPAHGDDHGDDQGDGQGDDKGQGQGHGQGQGQGQGQSQGQGQGQGPDKHAGNHPDEHASAHPSPPAGGRAEDQTTADRDQAAGIRPGDGAGGSRPR